jgi:hypothetical protein
MAGMPSPSPGRYQRMFFGLIISIAFVVLLLRFGNGFGVGFGVFSGDGSSDGITNQTLGVSNIQQPMHGLLQLYCIEHLAVREDIRGERTMAYRSKRCHVSGCCA